MLSKQEKKREEILVALQVQKNISKLSQTFNVSRAFVHKIKKKGISERKKGSGRKTKLTTGEKIAITKSNKEKLGSSIRKTAKKISTPEKKISPSCVQRYIAKQTWATSYKPTKKPILTQKQIGDRITFVETLVTQGYTLPRVVENTNGFFNVYRL